MRSQPPFILGDFLAYTQTYLQTHHFVAAMGIVALVILSVELCLLVARRQARRAEQERRERRLQAIALAQQELRGARIHRLVSPHAGGKDAA